MILELPNSQSPQVEQTHTSWHAYGFARLHIVYEYENEREEISLKMDLQELKMLISDLERIHAIMRKEGIR